MVASASPSFPAVGYGPLGPRLRRNGFANTDRIAPPLRSAIFPALAASRRAALATAPQNGLADTDRIAPPLRSLLANRGAGETVPRR